MATTAGGTPYVESSDLVADYPTVSLALAEHIDDLPAKILQVVRATDTTNRTTTSTSYVDVTGMTVTITPQKATSAVLIMGAFLSDTRHSSSNSIYTYLQIVDSSNNTISGAQQMDQYLAVGGASAVFATIPVTLVAYATPATTSAVTYKLRVKVDSGNTNIIYNARSTGQLYAIEVSA
jgi:hypothetical protein